MNEYIDSYLSVDSKITPYFTAHALVMIHAAFEQEVRDVVVTRCADTGDPNRDKFVTDVVNKRIRSIKVNELKGLLGAFDYSYKRALRNEVPDYDEAVAAYNNIENNRQTVAHQGTLSATWGDVLAWWPQALLVIVAFREILEKGVPSDDDTTQVSQSTGH